MKKQICLRPFVSFTVGTWISNTRLIRCKAAAATKKNGKDLCRQKIESLDSAHWHMYSFYHSFNMRLSSCDRMPRHSKVRKERTMAKCTALLKTKILPLSVAPMKTHHFKKMICSCHTITRLEQLLWHKQETIAYKIEEIANFRNIEI